MVVVSYSGKEINAKLVYYGPGLSGKTTNLEHIYQSVPSTNRGKMVSMKTRTERTLFFDFLPIDLGEIGGFKTRFLLYTVPGQVYYNATRKLVLRGVDAVIFVADSGQGKMEENLESLENLRENLREYGLSLDDMPWVIQYNKRDLPNAYTVEELEAALNPGGVPSFEAVANSGEGVFECFRGTARILLQKLSKEIKLGTTKPSAITAPRPSDGSETVSSAPPPGLMSGSGPGKGYRPPIPAPARPGAVPPAVPHPPRTSAPPPPPPEAEKPALASGKPYRPQVPGQAPTQPSAPPPPPRKAPELVRPGSSRVMPNPIPPQPEPEESPVGGADWFGDADQTVEMPVPESTSAVDEAFAPSLDLDETQASPESAPEAGTSWMHDKGPAESGYIETIHDEETSPDPVPDTPADRSAAFARRLEESSLTPDPEESLEDEDPGFWGRIFRRKSKDRTEGEQYRRYPTPDLTSPPKPSIAPEPLPVTPVLPVSHQVPPPALPRETKVKALGPVTLRLELPKSPAPLARRPTWDEEPVTIDRTIQVPVSLGPEELRRGVVLKLTLEIVIDGSRAVLDRDQAA